jgi:hypothetical protein
VGFVVDKVALGQDFPRLPIYQPILSFPQMLLSAASLEGNLQPKHHGTQFRPTVAIKNTTPFTVDQHQMHSNIINVNSLTS